jgi:undecaprenyl-diphosphatase
VTPGAPAGCDTAVNTAFTQLGALKIIVLGIVQGITELLPISSTAHLRIIPALLHWPDPGSAFSAAMQLASLAAIVAFFERDIVAITRQSLAALRAGRMEDHSLRMAVGFLIATIPIGIAGLALRHVLNACNSPLRGIAVIGWACIVMGVLLALAEIYGQRGRGGKRDWNALTIWDCVWVGIAQAFSLVPGVSRSGSTLTAALGLNIERATAARFSFLLGVPAIVLAGLFELWTLHKAGLTGRGWELLLIGLIAGSVASYAAIRWLLRYLEHHTAWVFAWYRVALGIVLLVGSSAGWLR